MTAGLHGGRTSTPLLTGSRRLSTLDHFCVPYEVSQEVQDARFEHVRAGRTGSALYWPARHLTKGAIAARLLRPGDAVGIPIVARIAGEAMAARLLQGSARERLCSVVDASGQHIASVSRDDDGSVFLPFDPDEVMCNYLRERYSSVSTSGLSRSVKKAAMRTYYQARPLMPRSSQIWLRRRLTSLQRRSPFPRWPIETALNDFLNALFALLSEVAGAPIPRIAPWPAPHTWALVLTHDVEHAAGYAAMDPVLDLEQSHGVRSAWYIVPRRYPVRFDHLRDLQLRGFEVGVHGLYHDGRDLKSLSHLKKRLPAIRDAAERWGAVGFRAPALHRHWDWMPLLGFDYDSSFPDTDPYEPMAGGCCSWLPFFIENLVELPVTLPQDHTLFTILHRDGETMWIEKTERIRASGGMALIDTHPDYLVDPHIFGAYAGFLESFAGDGDAWQALPREVAAWWRRRAASHLEYRGDQWQVLGPAAEDARVEFAEAIT
jgi:hypothetical protein